MLQLKRLICMVCHPANIPLTRLSTVLMDHNNPNSNYLNFLFTVCASLLPFYVKLEQLNINNIAKMNDRVPKKKRLRTSKLNCVFLKV